MCEPNHKKILEKTRAENGKKNAFDCNYYCCHFAVWMFEFEVCFVFRQWMARNTYKTFKLLATFHSFLTWLAFCSAILIFRKIFQFVAVSCVEVFWGVSLFDWRVPDMHCSTTKSVKRFPYDRGNWKMDSP